MRKFGKYEKMPDGTKAKQPAVKSALLQTYFTSLICLVLCVTMLFGTTFAWFTSEVTNSGNEIYIGTLDVGLFKQDGTDLSQGGKLFDGNIRWEPGYTALETITVKNEGDLAFRYKLTLTNPEITKNSAYADQNAWLSEVAKHFVVYVHEGDYAEGEVPPTSFEEIVANANNVDPAARTWKAVKNGAQDATLADILNNDLTVLSGKMNKEDVREDTTDPAAIIPGPNDSKATTHTYVIALHMSSDKMPDGLTEQEQKDWQESINALMGHKISLNVKLTAYQQTSEEDAFDANYDLGAFVNTLAQVNPLENRQIKYYWGLSGNESHAMTLDTAYQFLPTETLEDALASPYVYYIADYVIKADKDVPGNSMALAGYYQEWCQHKNDHWIALTTDDMIPANTEIRLVQGMGNGLITVNYEALCQYGNDGVGFLCGATDISDTKANAGTTITVQLRLYETYSEEECLALFGVKSKNKETGKYIVVGEYSYTFPQATTP